METQKNEMTGYNWLSTTALVNEGIIDYPKLKKSEFLLDEKGRRIEEWLISGTNSAQSYGKDTLMYNLRVRRSDNDVRQTSLDVDPNSKKIEVELEWKGEKKIFWYFKNQLDIFKEAFLKLDESENLIK